MKKDPSVLILKSDLQKENNLLDIIDKYCLNLFFCPSHCARHS